MLGPRVQHRRAIGRSGDNESTYNHRVVLDEIVGARSFGRARSTTLLRTNRFASYEIGKPAAMPDGKETRVTITSYGNLLLPVPVEARFANGDRQKLVLDRSRDEQVLEFATRAPLTEVVIDPGHEFPLVIPPPEIDAARLGRTYRCVAVQGSD